MNRVLLVEDDDHVASGYTRILGMSGYNVERCRSLATARRARTEGLQAVLLDIGLDDGSGLDLLDEMNSAQPQLPVIIMTGNPTVDSAIRAVRGRAFDYLSKPIRREALCQALSRALEARITPMRRAESKVAPEKPKPAKSGEDLIGSSASTRALRDQIELIASAPTTVLLEGETGTGKEIVARMLHQQSGRKGSFVAVNCAAVPGSLLETELFGHKKGSFTGAIADRAGLVSEASGGTLFLDEIAELDLELQSKLLRLLQDREYRVLGENRNRIFDGRIVAASHKDLRREVVEGRFREDLYWRLSVLLLKISPLRERPEDLEELAKHFIARHSVRIGRDLAGISSEALELLKRHSWPGNVRELENLIERAVLCGKTSMIEASDVAFQSAIDEKGFSRIIPEDDELASAARDAKRTKLVELLERHGGSVASAARASGRNRTSFYALLKRHGVDIKNRA